MDFIYPVLLAALPILTLYDKNFYEIDFWEVCGITAKIAGAAGLLAVILSLAIKNPHKASFITLLITMLFYKSGYFFIINFSKYKRSQFKIKLMFSLAVVTTAAIGTSLIALIPLSFKIFSLILNPIAVFAFIVIFTEVSKKLRAQPRSILKNTVLNNSNEQKANESLPDIYHIILDSYSGNNLLKRDLNFDNADFTNFLESRGFKCLKKASSNYRLTMLSVPSTLNYDYLDNYTKEDAKNGIIPNMPPNFFVNNLWELLLEKGYKILPIIRELHLWSVQTGLKVNENELRAEVPQKLDKSVEPIKCYSEKLYFSRVLLKHTFIGIWLTRKLRQKTAENTLKAFKLVSQASKLNEYPKCVFAHVICPHTPLVFDREGNILKEPSMLPIMEQFKNQTIGLNEHLKVLIDNLQQNMQKNSIILIHADHEVNKTEFDIFNAVYLPDNADILPDDLSLVNMFRYILNHYFGTNLEILEDEHF